MNKTQCTKANRDGWVCIYDQHDDDKHYYVQPAESDKAVNILMIIIVLIGVLMALSASCGANVIVGG